MTPPLAPTVPVGSPSTSSYIVKALIAAAGADVTSEGFVVRRTGYLSKVSFIAQATLTGADTDSRTITVVDPTTRAVTDGVTTISTSQVTSATAALTQDDVGKAVSGTGIPASTFIGPLTKVGGIAGTGDGTIINLVDANGVAVLATATGSSITVTIGSSRTLATKAFVNGVSATADKETDITLSTTDTKVFKGDVVKVVSTHVGSTGLADTGGVYQIVVTHYGEGSG